MGAIAGGGVVVLNDDVVRAVDLSPEAIEQVARKEGRELERRELRRFLLQRLLNHRHLLPRMQTLPRAPKDGLRPCLNQPRSREWPRR